MDDLLAALHRPDARENCLTWCGWSINFSLETIELTPLKTLKLKEQLFALLRSKRIKRKLLEQVLGLLIWATSPSLELRSWLAPLYARLWPAFLSKAVLASPVHGMFMPLGSRVLDYQQASTRSSSDLPRLVPSHKPARVRVADPAAEHTRLSAASEASVEWLLQCFQADLACPLRSKPILACKAAADACVEGATVGTGGWFISSRSVSWFAETWDFQQVQQQWPCLTKEAQRYIACFETLAQLALMRIAWTAEGQAVHGLRMPSGTDNTASEETEHRSRSMALADICAISRRTGLQAQMVSASLAYPRQAQRVGRSAQPRQHIRIRQQAASSPLRSLLI